jgi:L-ascorbate metabolism protein UlaG (beta-lactamase superfamily)
MLRAAKFLLSLTVVLLIVLPLWAAGPAYVDITWMGIANIYYRTETFGIVTDGYITRIPQSEFSGGGGGLASTRKPYKPDVAAVTRVLNAIGGASKVDLLLTGHSHFDHSFDTPTWSQLTDTRIIGPQTTCYQAAAQQVTLERCTPVDGGETLTLAEGLTMRVVRWNHSGDPAVNPEQHNPVELKSIPGADLATGGLRAGVAEDFPNGGGSRAFLFVADGPQGRFSWFYQNTASAVDLHLPIVVDGRNFGAPLDNLKKAMTEAGLSSVDLWIGTGGAPIARLLLPILKPKAYLPIHWDGLFGAFDAGVTTPYSDAQLEMLLSGSGIPLLKPVQYMDKWRLDASGVHAVENTAVKRALGFVRE